jgi:hypothetical protein
MKKKICWVEGCNKPIEDPKSFVCEKHKKLKKIKLAIPRAIGNPNIPV